MFKKLFQKTLSFILTLILIASLTFQQTEAIGVGSMLAVGAKKFASIAIPIIAKDIITGKGTCWIIRCGWSGWTNDRPPTCLSSGLQSRQCKNFLGCKKKQTRETYDPGHDFSPWVITSYPTTQTEGVEIRMCLHICTLTSRLCGELERRTIPSIPHLEVESTTWVPLSIQSDTYIRINSNLRWQTVSHSPWLNISPAYGDGNGGITLVAMNNETFDSRTGRVVISTGEIERVIHVTQLPARPPTPQPTPTPTPPPPSINNNPVSTININGDIYQNSTVNIKNIILTFHAGKGKVGKKKKVAVKQGFDTSVKLASEPYRKGYKFKGWYTKKQGGTQLTLYSKVPKTNKNYYAKWVKNKKRN